jgi:uncharacterized membrane protein SpoIIM required for sporulation
LGKTKRLTIYERASADLAHHDVASKLRISESLVARAYGVETRDRAYRFERSTGSSRSFPILSAAQRRFSLACYHHCRVIFGGGVISFDHDAKKIILPFSHLQLQPSERVKQEEKAKEDRLAGQKTTFSAFLMTHNTQVAIFTLALGMTWGIGTIIMLFYNGVILGAVAVDYILDGQTKFLLGWLMPHGVIEIPSILIAGQADSS